MNRYSSQTPSGVADILNPDDKRDSAYWSSGSNGDASKHNSVVSARMSNPASSPAGGYRHDKQTPPPINTLNRPLISPASNTGMSVASLVSPSTAPTANMDERMLGMLNRGQGGDASARSSYVSTDSRRDSIDNRSINAAISDMKINGAPSPYTNNHASTTSIQATLQNQRDPRNGPERLSASRFPSSYNSSNMEVGGKRGRTAPAITGVTPSHYANTATPMKGQAWAGPFDAPLDRISRGPGSIGESSRQTSYLDSRRGSIAESFASTASQMTTESALPHGQRRLDEYQTSYTPRPEHSSIDLATTHHHQLKHKQVGDLVDEEGTSPGNGTQPYSRTPELRVSHKLAERKRRDEMKTLYDNLRELMPQERGNKASKWEILSKAISEHKAQCNIIRTLQHQHQQMEFELQAERRENARLREELSKPRAYQSSSLHSATSNLGHPILGNTGPGYGRSEYDRGLTSRPELGRGPDLPPPRPLEPSIGHNQDSMSGVQYHHPSSGPPPQTAYRHENGAYGS